ncbi:transposable element Tcb2 transposase [Trichonephila clavipes]|nr:transposable element Tcb2 transposase [Trichonephila clavipes]
MSSRHHIDDFMRGRIIGKIEEGRKITDVAREFDIAHSVVSRLWKSFKTTGMCSRRHGEVVLEQVANQFLAASGKQISQKTVARRLRGGGLYARRPVVCVPLTRQHRTARLQWCREHHNWTEQDWACVLFSDESRFSLSSDCRRQLIWRESGTAYRPENIQEKDRYPTCSIMVWAGIMINGRTCLHVVANGTMTGQRYIDEVLLPHVRLFRGAVGNKFVFMDDNATCHQTLAVQDCLDSEGIQRLVWPVRSPDLNPIENVWDALGRQVAGRNYPPTNKNTLIRALTEEWDKLPQQLLDNVVQSMVQRVECCITLHGGLIPNEAIYPTSKGHDHWLSGQGWKHFETAEFVNCSHAAVVKVYRAWQNGTVQNQGRGKCGAPRAIDDRGERRLRRCVRADRRATVEQLTTKMNQGATKKCLPNYNSANIAASGPPKQTPGSCIYADYCLSTTKARICTPVQQLDVH